MKRIIALFTATSLWINVLAVVSLAPVAATMTGCTVTAEQVQRDGAVVGNMLISMAAVVQDAAKSAELVKWGQNIITATANFQTGSPVAYINDAINAATAILSSIPQTQAIALLLPFIEAAIDLLLDRINTVNKVTTVAAMAARVKPSTVKLAVIHHRMLRSESGDMRAAWNATVKANKLAVATI